MEHEFHLTSGDMAFVTFSEGPSLRDLVKILNKQTLVCLCTKEGFITLVSRK